MFITFLLVLFLSLSLSLSFFLFVVFFFSFLSPSDGPAKMQFCLVFGVFFCSADNHFIRKHLFFYTSVTACVGTGYKCGKRIVMTVTDFYFYFKILYELCIS